MRSSFATLALLAVTLVAPAGNAVKLGNYAQIDSRFGFNDPTIVTLDNVNAVKQNLIQQESGSTDQISTLAQEDSQDAGDSEQQVVEWKEHKAVTDPNTGEELG